MKNINKKLLLTILTSTILISCNDSKMDKEANNKIDNSTFNVQNYSAADYDYLAISNPNKLSAASKRALERGYHKNSEWFGSFRQYDLTGDFAYQEGVTRRDPTKVLLIDGLYHTWYSKTLGPGKGFETGNPEDKTFPWDKTDIWFATSKDGKHWDEQGMAVGRGAPGQYDDRSVFTPEVFRHDGKYYLVYQTIKAPYTNRVKNEVGLAYASDPRGPWTKLAEPILKAANNGVWEGEEDNRFLAKEQGDFDSHKVHDPTLMFFDNKFYLYYKGERYGEKVTAGGREIRWGVAIADKIEGPYIKSEYNPITHSGHELAIWHYNGGIAMASSDDGPEAGTIQFAEDGINFEIMAYVPNIPKAIGTVETLENSEHPRDALSWGLSHKYVIPKGKHWMEAYNYINGFSYEARDGRTAEKVKK